MLEKTVWVLAAQGAGTWVSSILFNVNQIGVLFSRVMVSALKDGFSAVALLIFLLWMSWSLTLIMFMSITLVVLLIRVVSKKLFLNNQRMQRANGRVTNISQQSLRAIREIKIFGGIESTEKEFKNASDDLFSSQMAVARYSAVSVPLIQVLSVIFIGLILFLSKDVIISGELSVGDFVYYIGALALLPDFVRKIINLLPPLERSLAGTLSFSELCSSKDSEVKMFGNSLGKFGPTNRLQIRGIWPLNRVGSTCRKSIHFDAGIGNVVVIEGPSGSGKSSLLDLLMGFVESDEEGSICVDSVPLGQSDLVRFRNDIAYVAQDSRLLSGSILDNLKLGKSSISVDGAYALVARVGLQEFVNSLPMGLHSLVGDLGDRLSGGQIQRLLIARALARTHLS